MNVTLLGRKQGEKEWIERSWLMNIVLFLCFANFLNEFFYLCLLALGIMVVRMFLNRTTVMVSKMFFATLLLSITFLIFGGKYYYELSGVTGVAKCFLYPVCFFIGENLVTGKREKSVHHVLYLITFAMATHGALNLFNNLDAIDSIGRNTYDIWTKQIWSATGQASLFVLLCGTAYYGLFLQKKKWLKLLTLMFAIIMLIYNTMFLAGRMIFIALAFSILFGLLLNFLSEKENLSDSIQKTGITLIILTLFVFFFIFCWENNVWEIRTAIESSNFFKRFSPEEIENIQNLLFDKDRSRIQKEYIRLIPTYPWGGNRLREYTGEYGHNIFLSALNIAGLPAMIMVFVLLVGMLWQTWTIYRCKNISPACRIWILSIYVAAFCLMMAEPVFEGIPWFVGGVLFISGIVNRMIKAQKTGQQLTR